jgi:amino acid transporter
VLGVVLTLAGAATAATVSLAFAGYLGAFVGVPKLVPALALVAVLTGLNVWGIAVSSRVNVVFTLLECAGLVAFVALGASRPEFGRDLLAGEGTGVLAGAALLFFAFLGFEDLVNLAEDAKEPARDLPRAILWSVAITTLLYVGVGLAAVALLEPERLAASASPLASAAETTSPPIARALGVVALFATANTALIALLSTSRLVFGMSRDGAAPKALSGVGSRRRTPWPAAVLLGVVAGALVPWGDVAAVASLASFAALLAFVAVNVCVIALRYREPGRRRPFRVPLAIGRFPVLPALGLASAGLLLMHFDVWAYVAGGAAVALALLLHGVRVLRRRRA